MAVERFGNLSRTTLLDELLRLGILQGRTRPKKKLSGPPGVARPTGPFTGGYGGGFGKGGYGHSLFTPSPEQLARPTEQWGFDIKRAMKPSKAFKTSRTPFLPSFRKYIRGW